MTNAELLTVFAARIDAAGTTMFMPADEFRQLIELIGYIGFDYECVGKTVAIYLTEARRALDMARTQLALQVKQRITQ
jgi:predicted glycosyltransferase